MYHLALYNSKKYKKDYIDLILTGSKKADIKILNKRIAPYEKINNGDVIFLKESGCGIRGCVEVESVSNHCFDDPLELLELMKKVAADVSAGLITDVMPWWERVAGKKYATVFYFTNPYKLKNEVRIVKNDRRTWVADYLPSSDVIYAFKEIGIKQF